MQVRIDARVSFLIEAADIFDGLDKAREVIKGTTVPNSDQVTVHITHAEMVDASGRDRG